MQVQIYAFDIYVVLKRNSSTIYLILCKIKGIPTDQTDHILKKKAPHKTHITDLEWPQ